MVRVFCDRCEDGIQSDDKLNIKTQSERQIIIEIDRFSKSFGHRQKFTICPKCADEIYAAIIGKGPINA